MFHTYVRAASGKIVDIGRAQFLMDKELARQTAEWVETNQDRLTADVRESRGDALLGASSMPDPPAVDHRDQAFWDDYCRRHREKYGTAFVPDFDAAWS